MPTMPFTGTLIGLLVRSLLVMRKVPDLEPPDEPAGGANRRVKAMWLPGSSVCGVEGPTILNSGAAAISDALLITSGALPVLYTVRSLVAAVPRATVPKLRSPLIA